MIRLLKECAPGTFVGYHNMIFEVMGQTHEENILCMLPCGTLQWIDGADFVEIFGESRPEKL